MTCKWCEEGHGFFSDGMHVVRIMGRAGFSIQACEAQGSDDVDAPITTPALDARIMALAEAKDTNPKDAIGCTKLPLHLVPATAIAMYSIAHHNGRSKYGAWNWRAAGVRASVYLDALRRHASMWENGEEVDPADGVPHLAAAGACLNILIDARACGKLTDDRPPAVNLGAFFDELTPNIARLSALHAAHGPRHYTIADTDTGANASCPGCGQDEDAAAALERAEGNLNHVMCERDEARGEVLGLTRQIEKVRAWLDGPSVPGMAREACDMLDAILKGIQ